MVGKYPYTGEDYSTAYETTLCTEMLPSCGRGYDWCYSALFPVTEATITAKNSLAGFNPEISQETKTAIGIATGGRCFFVTQKGYIGLGPGLAQKGGSIIVLLGGSTPYIIRPKKVLEYELLGESYVHVIMHVEALKAYMDSGKEFEAFGLV
jgi:hypothetical protein